MTRPDSIRWPGLVAAVCMLALAAGWLALAFGVGSVVVLVAAGWRRLRQCWREGI